MQWQEDGCWRAAETRRRSGQQDGGKTDEKAAARLARAVVPLFWAWSGAALTVRAGQGARPAVYPTLLYGEGFSCRCVYRGQSSWWRAWSWPGKRMLTGSCIRRLPVSVSVLVLVLVPRDFFKGRYGGWVTVRTERFYIISLENFPGD